MRVKRRVISMICLCFFLLPQVCFADPEDHHDVEQGKQAQATLLSEMRTLGESITAHRVSDGVYAIMGDEETHQDFSKENLEFTIETPFLMNLTNQIFHHQDYQEICALIEDLNLTYISSTFSGCYLVLPRALFSNDGIYQEANARTLCDMFAYRTAENGFEHYLAKLEISEFKITDDMAKVIVKRTALMSSQEITESQDPEEAGEKTTLSEDLKKEEGYLLIKDTEGWKVENILFDDARIVGISSDLWQEGADSYDFPLRFFDACDDPMVWKDRFDFEDCQHKDYVPEDGNYQDMITGDAAAPIFDYDRLREVLKI